MTSFKQIDMFGSGNSDSPNVEIKIQLVEPTAKKHRNAERVVSSQKNGRVVFGDAGKRLLGVEEGDYVLMGNVGGEWYIAKRPAGMFKGYKIITQSGKNKHTAYIQSQALRPFATGEYGLGTAINQDGVAWHKLSRVE